MNQHDCQLLNDYLTGDLDAPLCDQFETHLPHCPDCQAEVELQHKIDQALRVGNEATALPRSLIAKVDRRIGQAHRTRAMVIALGTAAAILLAVGIIALRQRSTDDVAPPTDNTSQLVQQSPPDTQPGIHPAAVSPREVSITFPEHKPAIATQLETEDPTVSIFLVYPVYKPAPADNL